MTVHDKAGGHTEWVRGANQALLIAVEALNDQGYRCYPLRAWLRAAWELRLDRLHDWAAVQLPEDEGLRMPGGPGERALRDTLDGVRALDIDPMPWLPEHVQRWDAR